VNERLHAADPAITSVFTFTFEGGSPANYVHNPMGMLISISAAERIFGSKDAVGKNIKVSAGKDTLLLSVAGVFEDYHDNSHDRFNIFIHYDEKILRRLQFEADAVSVYGRLLPGISLQAAEESLKKISPEPSFRYLLQPLPAIYFGPRVDGEEARHGDHYSVMILLCISALICFLALANFVNLTTLTLPKRAKELAIKKVVGASQGNLLFNLLRESFIITTLALCLAFVILIATTHWTLPILSLNITTALLKPDPFFILVLCILSGTVGMAPIAMTLPFTRASATQLLSTDTITFPRFRKNVIVFQLGISLSLVVAGLMIHRQINYSMIKEPGRNHDQIIYLPFPADMTEDGLYNLKKHWRDSNPHVVDVIAVSHLPNNINRKPAGKDFFSIEVDDDFLTFFNFSMRGGRWFGPNDSDSAIVNETGKADLALRHARAIGTVANFGGVFNQPDRPVRITRGRLSDYNFLCIRVLEVDIRQTISQMERVFSLGGIPAKVSLMDKKYEDVLEYENRLGRLTGLLTIISGVMACCAIYSLSLSISRERIRTVAVHKIFGAASFDLLKIFVRDFLRQMVVAILIFAPVTYLLLAEWLRTFAYAADFKIADPMISTGFCLTIIYLTCGAQAARMNKENLVQVLK
jgi:hypothetical protein